MKHYSEPKITVLGSVADITRAFSKPLGPGDGEGSGQLPG